MHTHSPIQTCLENWHFVTHWYAPCQIAFPQIFNIRSICGTNQIYICWFLVKEMAEIPKKKSVNTFSVLMIACISNTSLIAKLIFNYIPLKKHCSKLIFSGKIGPRMVRRDTNLGVRWNWIGLCQQPTPPSFSFNSRRVVVRHSY